MFFPDKIQPVSDSFAPDDKGEILADAPIVKLEVTKGRKIEARLVTVPVRRLRLNSNNPRMKLRVVSPVESEIEELLWREDSTRSLYNEIKFSGGLSEKPIVDARLVVLEGNRRTVCLRRLDDEVNNGELTGFEDHQFSTTQCVMLPAETDPKDVNLLLARAHVGGKKEWSPLSQAEQIHEMVNRHGMSTREIANALSLSPHSIEVMLKAFKATTEYGSRHSDADSKWIHKFPFFYELFRSRGLKEWGRSKRNLNLFMRLLSGQKPKLYRLTQVRELPRIINKPNAMELLRTKGFDEAIEKTDATPSKSTQLLSDLLYAANTMEKVVKEPAIVSNPQNLKIIADIRQKADFILARFQAGA
jgi:hypothetical protein